MSEDGDDGGFDPNMFEEPAGFRPPTPEGTYEKYERESACVQDGSPAVIDLYMISRHSLWAHRIWNAGVALARHLDTDKYLCAGKRILELGCAAALPSIISAINGAECTVASDYPDPHLLKSISRNLAINCPAQVADGKLKVVGLQWGQDDHLQHALSALPDNTRKFDVIFLADLIFNHTEHHSLLKTCIGALDKRPGSCIYVYFTSHVVKWVDRDMKFFEIAAEPEYRFKFEKFAEVKASAMFPDDVGDINVRETVNCYRLWKEDW
ncbi:nicotinamide n-methyltransferase [Entophlyctis luteolus]|nr:nicotinamide n-methyltransferase [Entophlyctis luteolus]